jgi:hypothetical protein
MIGERGGGGLENKEVQEKGGNSNKGRMQHRQKDRERMKETCPFKKPVGFE